MKFKKIHHTLFLAILLLALSTAPVFALEQSPAGGGALEITKRGGHVFVEDHDDFDANLVDAATIEMWIYLKRAPKFRESWVLFHKEGSYMVTLDGHFTDLFGELHPLDWEEGLIGELSYTLAIPGGSRTAGTIMDKNELPLNWWHHLVFIFGKKGARTVYLNGRQVFRRNLLPEPLPNTNFPLFIGGTGIFDTIFLANVKRKRIPFTGGLIDEVRVSNIVRYPVEKFEIAVPHHRLNPDGNTLALWHFDGGRAEWLKDASGNEHTLTGVDLAYFHVDSRGKLPTLWGKIKRQRE